MLNICDRLRVFCVYILHYSDSAAPFHVCDVWLSVVATFMSSLVTVWWLPLGFFLCTCLGPNFGNCTRFSRARFPLCYLTSSVIVKVC